MKHWYGSKPWETMGPMERSRMMPRRLPSPVAWARKTWPLCFFTDGTRMLRLSTGSFMYMKVWMGLGFQFLSYGVRNPPAQTHPDPAHPKTLTFGNFLRRNQNKSHPCHLLPLRQSLHHLIGCCVPDELDPPQTPCRGLPMGRDECADDSMGFHFSP